MSAGNTVWSLLDLKPGTDVAVCFVPDAQTGMPHFLMGMYTPFTVQ